MSLTTTKKGSDMDIDMSALRALVTEKEIPFEVVVSALQAALLLGLRQLQRSPKAQ